MSADVTLSGRLILESHIRYQKEIMILKSVCGAILLTSIFLSFGGCRARTFGDSSKATEWFRQSQMKTETCDITVGTYNLQAAFDCNSENNGEANTPAAFRQTTSNWYSKEEKGEFQGRRPCEVKANKVADAIEKHMKNPDILAVQELEFGDSGSGGFLGTLKSLVKKNQTGEPFFATAAMKAEPLPPALLAQGFLSRFTLDTIRIPFVHPKDFVKGMRSPVFVTFKELPNITFVNVHMPSLSSIRNNGLDAASNTENMALAKETQQALLKITQEEIQSSQKFDPNQAFVVLGDFNESNESSERFKDFLGAGEKRLRSVWSLPDAANLSSDIGTVALSNWNTKEFEMLRVDKILFSHHFFDPESKMKVTAGPTVIGPRILNLSAGSKNFPKNWHSKPAVDPNNSEKNFIRHFPHMSGPSDHFPLMATIQVPYQK
jgi:endonuclease/exonuclease/phosphatase family metal-dependent hydrolase